MVSFIISLGGGPNYPRDNRGVMVWLTKAEAADYAGVTPEVIRLHVRSLLLSAYAVGDRRRPRTYRLRAEDVDYWLETRPWNRYRDGAP